MESRQPPPTAAQMESNLSHLINDEDSEDQIPSEQQLVLLSLDYLRDLRRAYHEPRSLLQKTEGLNADWLTVAIYALQQALPDRDTTDAWKHPSPQAPLSNASPDVENLPTLEEMTDHVLYSENPHSDEPDLDPCQWYEYDDAHLSNGQRFFMLNGLGSSPLGMGEIAAAGLSQLQARSRNDAEKEMIASPLFEQFVQAVETKGFFKDPQNDIPCEDHAEEDARLSRQEQIYQERYAKVVAKFRTKLASKVPQQESMEVQSLADHHHARRMNRIMAVEGVRGQQQIPARRLPPLPPASVVHQQQQTEEPADLEEAERLKSFGNAHMQKKEYEAAAQSYTQALKLSPSGPNTHVYYSNRAAALLSMKRFQEAILDSERSLKLKPNYGKAHARLGLAHFLLGDYRQATEAYTVALKYEPDNKSSRSYLEKASKRLAQEDGQSSSGLPASSSFSVVSEWDKHTIQRNPSSAMGASVSANNDNSNNEREAEKFKVKGNQFMAQREYQMALDAYSQAIKMCPNGSQSHVYYSNRAASLCYLERYAEAAKDSGQSLKLNPTYGKAHARLGLSRFFLNDLPGAIQAYTAALEYDPDNAASKSYLAKAKAKLAQQKDSRRLMDNPDMHKMARKAMQNPSTDLMDDPEMHSIAKKAMSDPKMMEAVMAVQKVKEQQY